MKGSGPAHENPGLLHRGTSVEIRQTSIRPQRKARYIEADQVGGVLALKLHAFLALTLAAILVASLTPEASLERHFLEAHTIPIESVGEDGQSLSVAGAANVEPETRYLVLGPRGDSANSRRDRRAASCGRLSET